VEEDAQRLVIDTSVFMSDTEINDLINKYHVIIPYVVLEELDNLKESSDRQKSYNARKAIRFIENNFDDFQFVETQESDWFENDNKIIETARFYNCAIATNDLNMKVKCKVLQIPVVKIAIKNEDYKGYKIIKIDITNNKDNEILASIYENPKQNLWNLYINQYLIIRDNNSDKTLDIFRWNGNELVKLKLPPKKVISPLNDIQSCALDLLYNKDIPIKFLIGKIGSGKTYLATNLGFYYTLEKGLYNKVLVVRNPIGAGEDIGFLPGDKLDKVGEFYTPIKQNADISDIEPLFENGQLEFNIPFFIKGSTYDNTWMIIDECEDMDVNTIKIIGGRVGKNSCIIFCGDYMQVENKFRFNNGLKYAVDKLKGNSLVGVVFLEQNVRSDASSVFLSLG